MNVLLTQFATAGAPSGGVFGALGIDWQILLFQVIAFLILVWFLNKYIYPILMKTIDGRRDEIEASVAAAAEAEKKALEAEENIAKMLKEARKEAADIVATAHDEATAAVEAADKKAKSRADNIVADAKRQIDKEVVAAKRALHNETLELVARATEKVVGKAVSADIDNKLIASALKEVE